MHSSGEQDFYYRCLRPAARHAVHDQFIRQRFMTNLVLIPCLFILLILRAALYEAPAGPDFTSLFGWFLWLSMVVEVVGVIWHGDPWLGELVVPVVFLAAAITAVSATPVGFVWLFLAVMLSYMRLRDIRVAITLGAIASLSGVVILALASEYSGPNVFRVGVALLVAQFLIFSRRIETVQIGEKASRTTVLLGEIIDGLPQGVLVQDKSGKVTHYNDRALVLLGVESRRVESQPEVLDIRRDPTSLGMWVEHGHFRTVAGGELQVDTRTDASGGAVTTFTDISQMQRARDSAVALAAEKSRLLLEVGREFREPVYGLLTLLKEIAGIASDVRRRVVAARGEVFGQRLLALAGNRLEEVSALTLPDKPLTRPLELDAFLRDLGAEVGSFQDASHVEIVFHIDTRLPEVLHLDGLRLRQVLVSLLSNAIRVAVGGTVVLRVERLKNSEEAGKVTVRWSVQDDGPGIQPSQLLRVFEGDAVVGDRRGVGLSVSQFIARSLGTQITVASVPGYGATFSFNLVAGQEALAGVLGDSLRPELVEGTRVLLVTGAARSTEYALALLVSLGYRVESTSAETVPAKLQAAAEEGCPFGVVLLDTLNFKEGLQPFLVGVRQACAAGVITRTVAMVGHLQELQNALPASAQGMVDALLIKPYTPRMLVAALSGVLLAGNGTASLNGALEAGGGAG